MRSSTPTGTAPDVRRAGAVVPLAFRETGEGHPIVFLHGGGPGCSSWLDFRDVSRRLEGRWRQLFVDLAQYGDSAAGPIGGPALDFHAACVRSLLDELGLERVHVVAQSLGGSVALNLAALAPQQIGRIVLTGSQPVPRPASDPGLGIEARARYYGGAGPSEGKMRELLAALEWHDPAAIPDATVRDRYAASVTPWALAVAEGSGRGDPQDLSRQIGDVPHEALWLWGAHDPFASPAYAFEVASSMRHADVTVLAGTAHHPQEERPSTYARLVREFLGRPGDGKEAG